MYIYINLLLHLDDPHISGIDLVMAETTHTEAGRYTWKEPAMAGVCGPPRTSLQAEKHRLPAHGCPGRARIPHGHPQAGCVAALQQHVPCLWYG